MSHFPSVDESAAAHDFREIVRLAEAGYKREREHLQNEHSEDLEILMTVVRLLSEDADVLTDAVQLARQYGQADLAIMMAVVQRLCESAKTVTDAVGLACLYGNALEMACRKNFGANRKKQVAERDRGAVHHYRST